jgi:hypothetical protein
MVRWRERLWFATGHDAEVRRSSMATEQGPDIEVAQRFCDDVVLAAGCFKPNAPGRFELSGLRALGQRQLLKSRAEYFAEKVLIALTPVEVVAVAMDATSIFRTRRLVWGHAELRVQRVPSRTEPHYASRTALHLSRGGMSPRIEVAPAADDDATLALIDRLLGGDPAEHDRV